MRPFLGGLTIKDVLLRVMAKMCNSECFVGEQMAVALGNTSNETATGVVKMPP